MVNGERDSRLISYWQKYVFTKLWQDISDHGNMTESLMKAV